MTLLPDWFHRLIWAEIVGSASIRASIWFGPSTVVSCGNWYTSSVPRCGPSFRAATQAIMFGLDAGTIGWRSRNSGSGASGRRITT